MRTHNFGAGPSMLPEPVLQQIQEEMHDWCSTGMSIIEIGHRTLEFKVLLETVEADLRELLAIPDNYYVLFLSGPARSQFAAIPLNLLPPTKTAAYLDTGVWSHLAIAEARRFGQVQVAASSKLEDYKTIPDFKRWNVPDDAAYLYYTANETINGTEFPYIPLEGSLPLVCDMTSNILSKPLDISKYGLIFAGAQKNMGAAGLTVVVVRKELVGDANELTPTIDNYQILASNHSLYYTNNTFACYVLGLCLRWLKDQGGLTAMARHNQRKSEHFYSYLDQSEFYFNEVDKRYRSRMNIPFKLRDPSLQSKFLEESHNAGFVGLAGHRLVGGLRASLYNAISESKVNALLEFMHDFQRANG
jgi:phosphoserine aminotransferase